MDTREDPIAAEVEWVALEPGKGSNLRTHRLVKREDAWSFQPSTGVRVMVAVAWFFGAFGLLAGASSLGKVPGWGSGLALLAGAFFAWTGGQILKRIGRPSFDRRARRFRARPGDDGVAFGEVHAIQLAPYVVAAPNESERYPCYELNLVLRDASRRRVLAHGKLDVLRADAHELSTLLHVPLWDGTQPRAGNQAATGAEKS